MEELLLLEESGCGIRDAAVSLDLAEPSLTIDLVSEAATFEDARRTADSSIRTALHAAGDGTANWPYQATESTQRTQPSAASTPEA